MRTTMLVVVSCIAVLAMASWKGPQSPAAVLLTWSDDPTTTVTVDWHMRPGLDIEAVQVRGPGIAEWQVIRGESFPFPHSKRTVRRATIRGLQPDALYELRIGDSPVYRYRSMPAKLTRPVRFATGGDLSYQDHNFGAMNRAVAALDLDFVAFGGDLSYSDGRPERADREEEFFEVLTRTLAGEGNRLIPVVVAIGNHEVWETRRLDEGVDADAYMARWGLDSPHATYFRPLFAFPRERYYDALDIGDYLSLVALDSDHMTDVAGEQTEWLAKTLADREHVPHVFPLYHQPAYPSVRSFDGSTSRRIREHWVPLFERHHVNLVFENHDHAYKRTKPLLGGEVHPHGVVFMGDGAWGVGVRPIGRDQGGEPAWYLAESASQNHGIVVTLAGDDRHIAVITPEGRVIDRYHSVARRHVAADAAAH